MRKESVPILLFLSLIILSTMIPPASATNYTKVGLRVGDTADYTQTYYHQTGYPQLDINPAGNRGFHIEILQIAGTNVTINIRTVYQDNVYFNNSGAPGINQTGDLAGSNPIKYYLIAANLGVGDNIIRGDDYWHIDKTTIMWVPGNHRAVNHAEYTGPVYLPLSVAGISYDFYYDKETGLMVENNITEVYFSGERDISITTLTSTTAFPTITPLTPEEKAIAPLVTTAGIAIVAVIMVAAATTQHRQRKTTTI